MAIRFDGTKESEIILAKIAGEILKLKRKPRLTILYSGTQPSQKAFTKIKKKKAQAIGIDLEIVEIPTDANLHDYLAVTSAAAAHTDGILIQLPITEGIDRYTVLNSIPYEQDVEGLSFTRMGILTQTTPLLYSPVAKASTFCLNSALAMLNRQLEDQTVAIVGNSYLAGRPLALILSRECKSVVICNHRTTDLRAITKAADVIISVTGKPGIVTADMIKDSAILIDVGYSPQSDGTVLGDFSPDVASKAAFFTPVPGGTGPLTVALIFDNLIHLLQERRSE